MLREIKFRAWDKANKGFINGFNMFGFSTGQGCPYKILKRFSNEWKKEDFELMQYTGLKDKNGKEIYEGDIVASHNGVIEGVVVYQAPEFVIKRKPNYKRWSQFILAATENQFQEVVGNIYKNPELLEG